MSTQSPGDPIVPLDYEVPKRRRLQWPWIALTLLVLVFVGYLHVIRLFSVGRDHGIRSDDNLRQISQAIRLYAAQFGGQYPATFADLLANEDITTAQFVSPHSNDMPATGATTQAICANLMAPGHCSYIYLGKGLTTQMVFSNMIIAYETPAIYGTDGTYIQYGDGHAEFGSPPLTKAIQGQIASRTWPVTLTPPGSPPPTRVYPPATLPALSN